MSSIPPQMRQSRRQKERSMQRTDVRTSTTSIGDSPPLRRRQIAQLIYALPPTARLRSTDEVREIAQEAQAQNDGNLIVHGGTPSRPLPVVTSTSSSSSNAPPLGRRQIAQRARRERERANRVREFTFGDVNPLIFGKTVHTIQRSDETPAMRNDTANERIVDERHAFSFHVFFHGTLPLTSFRVTFALPCIVSQRFSQDSPSLQPRRMAQRARRLREKQIRTASLNTSNQRALSMDREFTEDDINLEEVCQCGGMWDHDDDTFDVNFYIDAYSL
ncbi:hypothetical protein EDB85DRAFT_2143862 [Lactarius pseudohatsudake]|nr:hypothetical protein EDB85DRAFT_2143862 [Lactarius pseudohatsudake]